MKKPYRIAALFMFLLMTATTGVFYQLYFVSSVREGIKLGTLVLALFAASWIIAWILQKSKVTWEHKH